jgi:Lambda phage tail tube protein, TTP
MPATKATIGYESTFSVGSGSPITYVQMAEVKSIKPSIATIPAIDATHLLSPNATEEKLPGLIKPGTIEIMGNFTGDASQLDILTLAEARTVFPFKVTGPVDSGTEVYTLTGAGFISKYDNGPFEPSKLIEFAMTMEITGTVAEAAV